MYLDASWVSIIAGSKRTSGGLVMHGSHYAKSRREAQSVVAIRVARVVCSSEGYVGGCIAAIACAT